VVISEANYIKGIKKVPKRATKPIANNPGISYIDRLMKLVTQHWYVDVIEET
jgi:hypothetical protein